MEDIVNKVYLKVDFDWIKIGERLNQQIRWAFLTLTFFIQVTAGITLRAEKWF